MSSLRSGASGPSVQGWVLPYLIDWVETRGFDAASIRKSVELKPIALNP